MTTSLQRALAWQAFPCGFGTKNEEREPKTARKIARVKERGGGGKNGRKRLLARFVPLPLPPLSFFGTRFISRAAKTENPVPLSFFTLKPNGNVFHVYIIFSYLICNLVPRVLSYPPYGARDIKKKNSFSQEGFCTLPRFLHHCCSRSF